MRPGWRETCLSSTYCCEDSKLKFRFETSQRATIPDQFEYHCLSFWSDFRQELRKTEGLWSLIHSVCDWAYIHRRGWIQEIPLPPPAQSKCYDPYRHLIVSVRDQQPCPLTTPVGKNYLGIDQECNSQGYEGYKVSVNYVYNIIREGTENWTFLSLTEQVIYNGAVHDSCMPDWLKKKIYSAI